MVLAKHPGFGHLDFFTILPQFCRIVRSLTNIALLSVKYTARQIYEWFVR